MPYVIYRTTIINLIYLCAGFNVAAQTTAASARTRMTLAEVLAKIPGPQGEEKE